MGRPCPGDREPRELSELLPEAPAPCGCSGFASPQEGPPPSGHWAQEWERALQGHQRHWWAGTPSQRPQPQQPSSLKLRGCDPSPGHQGLWGQSQRSGLLFSVYLELESIGDLQRPGFFFFFFLIYSNLICLDVYMSFFRFFSRIDYYSVEWCSLFYTADPYLINCSVHIGEGNGTHSSTLAWKIPRVEEPGRLPSMGSQRVGHD